MLIKILLLAGLVWVGMTAFRQWRRAQGPSAVDRGRQPRFEQTARCAQCGAYVPTSTLSRSGRCGKCSD